MTIQITAAEAPILIKDVLKAGLVAMLHSSPGMAKSAIAQQIANDYNLFLIDCRLSDADPTDLNGFPTIDKQTMKAGYIPFDTFPLEGDEIPKGYSGWLLLFDELSSAAKAVQAASYKILLDKKVGQSKIHKKVAMMAAGNLKTDNAVVNSLSTAAQSRMVHFELGIDQASWMAWAMKEGIDYRITSFINFSPASLHDFNPNHSDFTFACPRTWEFMHKIIKGWKEIPASKLPILAGTIGEGLARTFLGFCKIFQNLPTIQSIIDNPDTVNIPDAPDILYAITGLISNHIDQTNVAPLIKCVDRLPIEFQVICLQDSLKKDKDLLDTPSIQKWVSENSQELL